MAGDDSLDIPTWARKEIFERDGGHCRMCGVYRGPGWYEIHHIVYGGDARGMGGRRQHVVAEMVALCGRCHSRAHTDKARWQPILLSVVQRPGVTAFQLERWRKAAERRSNGRSRSS